MKNYLIFFLILMFFTSCDSGLKPEISQTSYVNGVIHYINPIKDWPPADSLKDLRVVAFKHFPPTNVVQEVLQGNAYYTMQTLPFFVDSSNFSLEIKDAPVELKYIAVVQQFGGLLDWRVVGLYSQTKDSATYLLVENGKTYFIDITVDFNNLPKQPF